MVGSALRTAPSRIRLRAFRTPDRRHRHHSTVASQDVSEQLRAVMRNVPQPVAIAVTARPDGSYHGATLSSFTSLTLHPHPLVAFSLRLPSKLADYLRSPLPSSFPRATGPGQNVSISLLSRGHDDIAKQLARPGTEQVGLFAPPRFDTRDPPGLVDAIGRLHCEVISSLPLRDVCEPTANEEAELDDEVEGAGLQSTDRPPYPNSPPPSSSPDPQAGPEQDIDKDVVFDDEVEGAGLYPRPVEPVPAPQPSSALPSPPSSDASENLAQIHGSELFICKVLEVEVGQSEQATQPMLYWKQKYTGVQDPS